MDALITTLLIVALFVLLGSGVWIGLALFGVAWIGMELFNPDGHFSSLGHLAGNLNSLSAALRNPGRAAIMGAPLASRTPISRFSAIGVDLRAGVDVLDRAQYTLTEMPEIHQAIADFNFLDRFDKSGHCDFPQ